MQITNLQFIYAPRDLNFPHAYLIDDYKQIVKFSAIIVQQLYINTKIRQWYIFETDNHPVHHVQDVIQRVYDFGAIIRFLPPYSPDLNPIEEVFAKVKHYLRQNDVVLQSVQDTSPLIWEAFGQISQDDCLGYMHHAGYFWLVFITQSFIIKYISFVCQS